MTDWPEAVENLKPVVWIGEFGDCGKMYHKADADAAIAALKEMADMGTCIDPALQERAEKAEAELALERDHCKAHEEMQKKAEAEVERLNQMLDLAWTERRKIRAERKYGISLRTKKMWLADLAARYEKEQHGTA